MKQLFSTYENRQPKTVVLKRRKTNKLSPIIVPTFCLGVQSKLQKRREGSQAERSSPEWRQRTKFREAEKAGCCTAEFHRGGCYAEKDLQNSAWGLCICRVKFHKAGQWMNGWIIHRANSQSTRPGDRITTRDCGGDIVKHLRHLVETLEGKYLSCRVKLSSE